MSRVQEFRKVLKNAREKAKKAGMKPADVTAAIRKVRDDRKDRER